MRGAGGPSLNYFTKKWLLQSYNFHSIHAYKMVTDPSAFYESVPNQYMGKAHYTKCAVSFSLQGHSIDRPFLPKVIQSNTSNQDYVLFKLDIDSPKVEAGNIDYILKSLSKETTKIDELF